MIWILLFLLIELTALCAANALGMLNAPHFSSDAGAQNRGRAIASIGGGPMTFRDSLFCSDLLEERVRVPSTRSDADAAAAARARDEARQ